MSERIYNLACLLILIVGTLACFFSEWWFAGSVLLFTVAAGQLAYRWFAKPKSS